MHLSSQNPVNNGIFFVKKNDGSYTYLKFNTKNDYRYTHELSDNSDQLLLN
jgi:hypothetical protein